MHSATFVLSDQYYQEFIIREGEYPTTLWPCVVTVRPTIDLFDLKVMIFMIKWFVCL